jgi:hypothetical protein
LSDFEIVTGKLFASLIQIFTILLAGLPVLAISALLGGISYEQVFNLFVVTAASGVAGGALGQLVALWRDRTFQSLSLTLLMVVFSIVGVEAIAAVFPYATFFGQPIVEILNPYRAMFAVLYPASDRIVGFQASSFYYIAVRLAFAASLIAFGTWKLRAWNPGRNEPRELREGQGEVVESLVEVEEEEALELELVGVGASRADGSARDRIATRQGRDRSGPTTSIGLHVPRRTHRRLAKDA